MATIPSVNTPASNITNSYKNCDLALLWRVQIAASLLLRARVLLLDLSSMSSMRKSTNAALVLLSI